MPRNCSQCQNPLPQDAQFCGRCGTRQQREEAVPATLPPPGWYPDQSGITRWWDGQRWTAHESPGPGTAALTDVPAASGDGSLDLGFSFPVKVWSNVDRECAAAYDAYESAHSSEWAGREEVLQFGYFSIRNWLENLDPYNNPLARVGKAMLSANRRLTEHMFKASGYSPYTVRYFYRDCTLQQSQASNSGVRLRQLTYVRTMQLIEREKSVDTYPPAPIANLVVATLPGRVKGTYACNAATGQFLSHPARPSSPSLLANLNAHLLPGLAPMWQGDFDIFDGASYQRGGRPGSRAKRWLLIFDDEQSLEPVFSPTLFQTAVLNPNLWSKQRVRMRAPEARVQEFSCAIVPCGPSTLLVVQYPTSNVWNRRGSLVKSHLRLDAVSWLVDATTWILGPPDNRDEPTGDSILTDFGDYLAVVGTTRQRPMRGSRNPNERWLSDLQGQWLTQTAVNQPVLPLEAAIRGS